MNKDPFSPAIWPTHIKLNKQAQTLDVEFDDGSSFTYTAEYLRVESPSAEVRGHGSSQKNIIPGCKAVHIKDVESVGNYAIRIRFDDNHDTGIYSWTYLHELGKNKDENWRRYLEILHSLGLSR